MKSFSNSIDKIPRPSIKTRGTQFSKGGFTLIEMIVALGIFSVVAVVALGALVKIISANKKAQTLQASITNLNFALDAMSRELRVGTSYYCADSGGGFSISAPTLQLSCTGASVRGGTQSTVIAFNSSKTSTSGISPPCNLVYAYLFDSTSGTTKLKKAQQSVCGDIINTNSFTDILDPNVTINGYYVNVTEVNASNPYPRATIRISGYAGIKEKEKTYFDVQTTVAARMQ